MEAPRSDSLPDGTPFCFWERPLVFHKTYYVAQNHPGASDGNPGTMEQPFRTIGCAAKVAGPGERVVIDTGIYRECVRPCRGGDGPEAMMSFEAAPQAKVIITGAEIWQTAWTPSTGWRCDGLGSPDSPPIDPDARVWQGRLPAEMLCGSNPFAMINLPKQARFSKDVRHAIARFDRPEYWIRRGLLFVDGKPLRQVLRYHELWRHPGTFWIEDDGLTIHLRLQDNDDPIGHQLEFTAREQAFVPERPHLGWIRVQGLNFERVGNGIPVPQRGALSTFCGHHWIIENNIVRWANSVGIDIGHQSWHRQSKELSGYHAVRRNKVSDCGVCGICGVGGGEHTALHSTLVEDNSIERCAWHNIEHIFENAGIKLHLVRNSLVRGNTVRDTGYGPGIWLDFNNVNSRICCNVVINSKSCMFGAIFVEASHKPNQIDGNVVWGVGADETGPDGGGHGIYEHDCDHLLIEHNLVANCAGSAIYLSLGELDRISEGRGSTGRKQRVLENILANCRAAIVFPTPDNFSDGNRFGSFSEPGALRIQRPYERLDLEAWKEFHGWEATGTIASIEAYLDLATMELVMDMDDGKRVIKKTIPLQRSFDIASLLAT